MHVWLHPPGGDLWTGAEHQAAQMQRELQEPLHLPPSLEREPPVPPGALPHLQAAVLTAAAPLQPRLPRALP